MPIVVAHEPAYPVVGTAAYGVGRGMARERLEEQLQRRAERDAQRDFEARRMERQAQLQADRDQWQAETEKAQREADFGHRAALEQYAQEGRFDLQEAAERGRRETARDELQRKWNIAQGLDPDGFPPPEPKFSPAQEMERAKLKEEISRVDADPSLGGPEKVAMLGALGQKYASIEPEVDDVRQSFRKNVIQAKMPDGSNVPGVFWIRKANGEWTQDDSLARIQDSRHKADEDRIVKVELARDKAREQAEAKRAGKIEAAEKLERTLKEDVADGLAKVGFLGQEIERAMMPVSGEDEDARRKRLDKVGPLQAKLRAASISVQADQERLAVNRAGLRRLYGETLGVPPAQVGEPVYYGPEEAPPVPPETETDQFEPLPAGAIVPPGAIGPVPGPAQEAVDFIIGARAAAARPPAPARPRPEPIPLKVRPFDLKAM